MTRVIAGRVGLKAPIHQFKLKKPPVTNKQDNDGPFDTGHHRMQPMKGDY